MSDTLPTHTPVPAAPADETTSNERTGTISRRQLLALASAGATSALVLRKGAPAWAAALEAPPSQGVAPQKEGTRAATGSQPTPNRAPLQAVPFTALPLGSIKARGWLLHQLELQRDGLTGHAEGLLPAVSSNSAWRGGTGEDWEKGPYYLKGLVALAYTLDDPVFKAKAQEWIEPILSSQREDGFFGPKNDDWWPRMVVTYLLRDYAEATGDARVAPLLTRYYRYMAANLPTRPLKEWGKARAGDEIDTVFWLYNRTGDAFLLGLADTLYQQAYAWSDIFTHARFLEFGQDFHPKHGVNVPQALKLPSVYWQRSKIAFDRDAFGAGVENLARDHGLAVGISSGTEFLAGRSSTQGIELCSIVERMLSDETALRILGDATIGDNLEMLAFNALPAALSKDIHQHVYYTLPNNVTAPDGHLGFTQDYANGRIPSPISGYPCCCYNFHMGWPKLTQNSWAATKEGGLALLTYVPSQVTAPVSTGQVVSFVAETNYPFEEMVSLKFSARRPTRFPLSLRIPGWCEGATISVNGKRQAKPTAGTFAVINRTWKTGDEVVLNFPMSVQTHSGVNNSLVVQRGPLLYTLEIEEHWKALGEAKVKGFEAYEVQPTTDWNYGLIVDRLHPQRSFEVVRQMMGTNPFDKTQTPVVLHAKAKKLPQWTLAWNGHVAFDPPVSPVTSTGPETVVSLVPFGSQMLRVTNFPFIGESAPLPTSFHDNFAQGHFNEWVTYGGGWLIRENAFGPSADAPTSHAVATQAQFRDFTYNAEVAVGESGDAGLTFRVSNPAIGNDAYNGYYIGLSAPKGQVELGRVSNVFTSLQMVPKTLAPNTFYPMRVEAKGARLRVWVGDMTQPLIEVVDTTFTEGAIGVRQYGGKSEHKDAEFRAISVFK